MRLDKAEEGSGEGTLAAARRADDTDLLARLDRESQVLQDVREFGSVANPQLLDLDVALRPVCGRTRLDNLGRLS